MDEHSESNLVIFPQSFYSDHTVAQKPSEASVIEPVTRKQVR